MQTIDVQGAKVPALGFGTAGLRGDAGAESVRHAIELGYRQIDTARMYGNEADVGKGWKDSGVAREDLFIVTKLGGGDLGGSQVGPSTEDSLGKLQSDYVDLLLIHFPSTDVPLAETLGAMVKQKEAGKVRHIGVSNFRAQMLKEAIEITPILADQVPYSVGRTQRTLCELAKDEGVIVTAYSPLRGPGMNDPALAEIAAKHGKSKQQVALRWLLQQPNVSPIPRSGSPEHRASNLDVFDFELTADEVEKISAIGQQAG